jgi:hypothetical protein
MGTRNFNLRRRQVIMKEQYCLEPVLNIHTSFPSHSGPNFLFLICNTVAKRTILRGGNFRGGGAFATHWPLSYAYVYVKYVFKKNSN